MSSSPRGPSIKQSRDAKPDPELVAGTTAHYEDPAYYERTYRARRDDVEFYLARVRDAAGAVLEYGCGNGRITLPIARAGFEVFGVDLSEPMLADLRARLPAEDEATRRRVELALGDMRSFQTKRRFPLAICPFNAFLHLYTREDVEQFLARVREHLAPGGAFVFDVSIPQPSELARNPERLYRTRPFVYPGVGRVKYGERFDYEPLRQVLFVSMEFTPDDGEPFVTPLAHRQFYPLELEALLHYNGFEIEETVGDFIGPVTHETVQLAITARPR
ncbi:MAG: class I SAM-dependent methyltransferase [Polyangiaceae bacterium]